MWYSPCLERSVPRPSLCRLYEKLPGYLQWIYGPYYCGKITALMFLISCFLCPFCLSLTLGVFFCLPGNTSGHGTCWRVEISFLSWKQWNMEIPWNRWISMLWQGIHSGLVKIILFPWWLIPNQSENHNVYILSYFLEHLYPQSIHFGCYVNELYTGSMLGGNMGNSIWVF